VASLPVLPGSGDVTGQGRAWIEIGETRSDFQEWLGDVASPSDFPLEIRYNGGTPGLYGMGVQTDRGVVEIRRPPVRIE
jgi:hypothetical protein